MRAHTMGTTTTTTEDRPSAAPAAAVTVDQSSGAPNANHHHQNSNPQVPITDVMTVENALSEKYIFSPGALVRVITLRNETIDGEVLAFEYNARLLILKQRASNGLQSSSNVTILNLELCRTVSILAEPDPERAAETDNPNSKLPDIDIPKLDERFANALAERRVLINAIKSGVGMEGVQLYQRLQKTVGDHFGVSWEKDSIIIGKNIQIASPYRADNINIRVQDDKVPQNFSTSLDYTKQLVEKYWRDQDKDPYTLDPLAKPSPPPPATTGSTRVNNSKAPTNTNSSSPKETNVTKGKGGYAYHAKSKASLSKP